MKKIIQCALAINMLFSTCITVLAETARPNTKTVPQSCKVYYDYSVLPPSTGEFDCIYSTVPDNSELLYYEDSFLFSNPDGTKLFYTRTYFYSNGITYSDNPTE